MLAIIISAGRVRVSPPGSGLVFQILTGFRFSLGLHYTVQGTGPCIILYGLVQTFQYISGVWNSGPMKTSNNKSSGIFTANTFKVLHISREGKKKVFWLCGLNCPFNVTPLLEKTTVNWDRQFSKSLDLLYKELFFFVLFLHERHEQMFTPQTDATLVVGRTQCQRCWRVGDKIWE